MNKKGNASFQKKQGFYPTAGLWAMSSAKSQAAINDIVYLST